MKFPIKFLFLLLATVGFARSMQLPPAIVTILENARVQGRLNFYDQNLAHLTDGQFQQLMETIEQLPPLDYLEVDMRALHILSRNQARWVRFNRMLRTIHVALLDLDLTDIHWKLSDETMEMLCETLAHKFIRFG